MKYPSGCQTRISDKILNLTEIEEQAMQLVRRTASIYDRDAIVTHFKFDEPETLKDTLLSIK